MSDTAFYIVFKHYTRLECCALTHVRIQYVGDDALFKKRESEMQEKYKRRDGSTMTLAQSKRASELQRDINAWEENRLVTSGVARYKEVRYHCVVFIVH